MSLRTSALRAVVVALAAGASFSSLAKSWNEVEPGITTAAQLRAQFGEPAKSIKLKDREVLLYIRGRAIKGTSQVQFRIGPDGVVERIDVFPNAVIDASTVEGTYGGPCGEESKPRCYKPKLTSDNRVYFLYPREGLAVFFKADKDTVHSFVYVPEQGAKPASDGTKTATTTGSGEGGEDGETKEDPGADTTTASTELSTTFAATGFNAAPPADTLNIGGVFYLRGEGSMVADTKKPALYAAPMLADLYLDGTPNDRVRGMMVTRLQFDPTLPEALGFGGTDTAGRRANPRVAIDQLWLKFDIQRSLFVTLGRQHVKWGTGRFWNPTDFLAPVKRDALALYDDRLGRDMLKLHFPVEAIAANFYAVGFVTTTSIPAQPLRGGVALRGEIAVGSAELGVSTVLQQGRRPQFGADLSAGLGFVDLIAEVALKKEPDAPTWSVVDETLPLSSRFTRTTPQWPLYPSAMVGARSELAVTAENTLELGAEVFWNGAGYTDPRVLTWLVLQNQYQPLYSARLYAAAYAFLRNTSVMDGMDLSLFAVSNLADNSYLGRMNLTLTLLTDLHLEAFAAVPLGRAGGELRFAADVPSEVLADGTTRAAIQIPLTHAMFGLGFRINY